MTEETRYHVTRTFPVENAARPGGAERLLDARSENPGIVSVAMRSGGRVRLTYDLRQATVDDVEAWLAAAGHPVRQGLLYRLRRGWARFADANEVDNLGHQGACCSKPPARGG